MRFNTAHNITSKLQAHTQGNVTDHGVGIAMSNEQIVPKTSYKLVYEEHAQGSFTVPGQDGDVSYVQPHAPRVIKETPDAQTYATDHPEYREQHLDYDANGNMLSIKLVVNHEDSPDVRDGVVQQQQTLLSSYIWDEENRLRAVNMNPEQPGNNQIAVYTYDAAGQRVVRHIPSRLDVRENGGARSIGDKAVNVLYPSPLVTAQAITANGKATAGEPITSYTKHYYMDATRVASTLGTVRDLGLYPMMEKSFARNLAPVIRPLANTATQTAQTALLNTYAALGQTSNTSAPVIEGDLTSFNHVYGENEPRTYWYHPDHLGSSSYITNVEGIVTQHMEYMPYGESLVEEHQNSINTPYKFNGKELDDESGNYYYGARYYNPKFSFWLSVDPLAEKFYDTSPYTYVSNNPLRYIDPTGMSQEDIIIHYKDNKGNSQTHTYKYGEEYCGSNEFVSNVYASLNHMVDSGADTTGVIKGLANSKKNDVNIKKNTAENNPGFGQNRYTSYHYVDKKGNSNIIFDPTMGAEVTKDNGIMTLISGGDYKDKKGMLPPSLVLLHELGHSESYLTDPDQHVRDGQPTLTNGYVRPEEFDVITTIEHPAAKKLGYIQRNNHRAYFQKVESAISNKLKK